MLLTRSYRRKLGSYRGGKKHQKAKSSIDHKIWSSKIDLKERNYRTKNDDGTRNAKNGGGRGNASQNQDNAQCSFNRCL